MRVKSLIITGYGVNCEKEMALGYQLAGATATFAHINAVLQSKVNIFEYNIINFPGGFSFGDELGAAKALANKITFSKLKNGKTLREELVGFVHRNGYILGVCNGFQLLVRLGLLPNFSAEQEVSLAFNSSGKFEDRWVLHKINPLSPCVFTNGIDTIYLPVRHGEGKFCVKDSNILRQIQSENLDVLQYCDKEGKPTMDYPQNPNGSLESIGGICDRTGRIFGMMAHPEAFLLFYNHPKWTSIIKSGKPSVKGLSQEGSGLAIFKNVINCAIGGG